MERHRFSFLGIEILEKSVCAHKRSNQKGKGRPLKAIFLYSQLCDFKRNIAR